MVNDKRSNEERLTHTVLVVGRDPFMTQWGRDAGVVGPTGHSLAAWACREKDAQTVMRWVKSRGDIKKVRFGGPARLGNDDHLTIYVVRDGHVALDDESVAN